MACVSLRPLISGKRAARGRSSSAQLFQSVNKCDQKQKILTHKNVFLVQGISCKERDQKPQIMESLTEKKF